MPKDLSNFLNESCDGCVANSSRRICVSMIADECSIIQDFGKVKKGDSATDPYYQYGPDRHSISEVRIDGEVYFEEHNFGQLRFIVRREPKEMLGKLAPHGTLHWEVREFGWWETDSHLSDWDNTAAIFDVSKKPDNFNLPLK